MATPGEAAASIDSELKEIEQSIADLLKRKAELVREREAIRAEQRRNATPSPSAAIRPANKAVVATPPAEGQAPVSTKALEAALNAMEWSSFKKREGEWAFLRTRNGQLIETLEGQTEFVDQLRRGKELVVGRYRYKVSEDRFLNRYFEA